MCMDEDVWVSVFLEKFDAGAMHPCRMLELDSWSVSTVKPAWTWTLLVVVHRVR